MSSLPYDGAHMGFRPDRARSWSTSRTLPALLGRSGPRTLSCALIALPPDSPPRLHPMRGRQRNSDDGVMSTEALGGRGHKAASAEGVWTRLLIAGAFSKRGPHMRTHALLVGGGLAVSLLLPPTSAHAFFLNLDQLFTRQTSAKQ